MRILSAFAIGLVFGLGIVISGMGNPAKVLNFFDIAGFWDPSLAFVMGGALTVTFLGYRTVLTRPAPLLEPTFRLPTAKAVDARLILGASTFGVGWGIAGFCPGAALPIVGTGRLDVIIFAAAMIAGIVGTRLVTNAVGSAGHRSRPA